MNTLDTLTVIYRNLQRLSPSTPIPADHQAQLTVMAQGIDAMKAGNLGTGWSYPGAYAWIADSVRSTTSVAALSYGFMTGSSVTGNGLNYLISPTGGNPNNLNSDYYAKFSMENRYINFTVAIAKEPAANMKFVSDFAPLSLSESFKLAYGQIIGQTKTDAELQAILTPERAAYFQAFGGDGANGLGTKAAMVGWLLAEAVKAHTGPWVTALDGFLRDLALDGDAHQTDRFLQTWGRGGDYAEGGPADPGLPGQTTIIQHDWNVGVNKPIDSSDIHPVATDGNDIISSANGYDAGKTLGSGAGNDAIAIDGGAMRGMIDAGSGNDVIVVSQLDGEVRTGTGHDAVVINGLGGIDLSGAEIVPTAVIADFQKGFDSVEFGADLGPGDATFIATLTFLAPVNSLKEMVQIVSGAIQPGKNGVFEWNGSTYVFHQTGAAALEAGDGLVKLVGVTGLSVANGAENGDLHFGLRPGTGGLEL
jgi:hypothetical protein